MSAAPTMDRDRVLERALPRFEHRPQQQQMMQAVSAAFAAPRHLIVEAGTGVGKSFAYLLPAIEHVVATGEKVVVSTYTIALQEQLIEKDIPALIAAVGKPIKAVLVKGRQNYLGLRRLMQTSRRQHAIFSGPDDLDALHRIEDWAYETTDGSLSDLDFQPLPQLWQRVRSESNNCMGMKCESYDKCFYQRARRRAEDADLLVVNHALFFADLALRQRNVAFLPDYQYVVLDEAHNIESVAADHFGLTVSAQQMALLLNAVFNPQSGRGFVAMLDAGPAVQAATEAHRRADALFDDLAVIASSSRGGATTVKPNCVENLLSPALKKLSAELKSLRGRFDRPDDQFELRSLSERCRESADLVETLIKQDKSDYVYWLEAPSASTARASRRAAAPRVRLHAAPISVADILREDLFERTRSVVLTSATLSVGGDDGFRFLRRRLGLTESDELAVDSPFDYRRQATLYVETKLPEPNHADFTAAAARRIAHYVDRTRGRAFVLFTSYRMLNETADLLADHFEKSGITLLVQGRGMPRGQMLRRFRAADAAVMFGTDSFWQGVDVPGDALSNVIITKLPFAAPDQPLLQARCDAIRQHGGEPFMDLQVPEAVLKLKQGFGRLIRTRDDTGIVVILDRRIKTKPYGRRFLNALPPCRVVYM
jgi:ATP-dependent DNA helicase DinG